MKIEFTETQEQVIGDKLAETFKLKRDREHKDRWVMGNYYGTKTSIGLCRTFRRIAEEIESGQLINELTK